MAIFSLAQLAIARPGDRRARRALREYCRVLAEHLSQQEKYSEVVDGDFIELLYLTSPLHDIGKVSIPDEILLKAGPLTEAEFNIMKQHSVAGSMTLQSAIYAYPEAKYLYMARRHRPQPPRALRRQRLPRWFGGRGDSVVRPNRRPGRRLRCAHHQARLQARIPPRQAHQIICEGIGTQFDPDVGQAYLAEESRFVEIHNRFAVREEREARVLRPLVDMSLNC